MTRSPGNPMRVLQITDSHLGEDRDESLIGLRTADSFEDVLIRASQQDAKYDLILATGDMSNDGTCASYERFIAAVNRHFPTTPIAWLEGNHDNPASMRRLSSAPASIATPLTNYVVFGGWRFILLNSRVPFEERGELHPAEIQRLSRLLESDPISPTMVFLHHQIVPVGCTWLDTYTVSNAHEFFEVIDRFNNVKAVSWGHVHQEFYSVRRGVDLLATPSTCVQFKPLSHDFAIDNVMPGFRVYEFFQDGTYQSTVNRIKLTKYAIDYESSGY